MDKKTHVELELHKPENPNVHWLEGPGSWFSYIGLLIGFRILFWTIFANSCNGWTALNLTHNVISFWIFHWAKGSPFEIGKRHYDSYTFWEQIDLGVQWTATRKFLMLVPVILFLITANCSQLNLKLPFLLNFLSFLIVTIAKLPFMNRVRVLGINQ